MDPITTQLDYGTSGPEVKKLQEFLMSQGFDIPFGATGNFFDETLAALQAYQTAKGIVSSGYARSTGFGRVGPMTLRSINTDLQSATPTGVAPDSQNVDDIPRGATGGTPYFLGDAALVRITGDGTRVDENDAIWYVDKTTKTIRPFADMEAVQNAFEGPISDNQIKDIPAFEFDPEGMFGSKNVEPGFQILPPDFVINSDGSTKKITSSTATLRDHYGQEEDEEGMKLAVVSLMGEGGNSGFLGLLKNVNSGIGASELNTALANNEQMAFYANALAYGGYTLPDIWRDLKARELGLDNAEPISATITRDQYVSTNDYFDVSSNAQLTPPPSLGGISTSQLNLPIYNIPQEAFETLVPLFDFGSEEFKSKMADVESAYHDILIQQINANTEQEKAVADHQWQQFRDDLDRNFGIQLSNNALDAWGQIEQAYETFENRGIGRSGIQAESIDDFLRNVRRSDEQTRGNTLSQKEAEELRYFRNFATPEQIKELIATDPEKAQNYGLIPSSDIRDSLSMNALKTRFPGIAEEDLARYRAPILDEFGNFRSDISRRKVEETEKVLFGAPQIEAGGKAQFQQEQVIGQTQRDIERSFAEFQTPESRFIRADNRAKIPVPETPVTPTQTSPVIPQTIKQPTITPVKTPSTPVTQKTDLTPTTNVGSLLSRSFLSNPRVQKIAKERKFDLTI